jgi:hypothetical protein
MKNFILVAVASLILFPLSALSQGTVLYVKNQVQIDNKSIAKGDKVQAGQTITTGQGSMAVLLFDNSSTVKVNENSIITLKAFDKKKRSTRFSLMKGSGFFKLDPKAKGKLSVQARTVAMGVRGTLFFVSYGKEKKEDVYMCVQEGKVAIRGKSQRKPVLVNAGQGVVVAGGLKSSKPSFLPWTKNLNWELDPKKKDLENKISIEEGYASPLDRDYD